MSRDISNTPDPDFSSPSDSHSVSLFPVLLDHVRLLTEILLEEQELLLSGRSENLEDVLFRKILESDRFASLIERSGLEERFSLGEEPASNDPENGSFFVELRASLLHLSEIASVNLVIARESAQTVAGFLKALRQSEGDFETYGARGDLGMALGSPSMVSTRR